MDASITARIRQLKLEIEQLRREDKEYRGLAHRSRLAVARHQNRQLRMTQIREELTEILNRNAS